MNRVHFLSMVFMVISCIVGFAIPIILFISERRSRREMIFIYCGTFNSFCGGYFDSYIKRISCTFNLCRAYLWCSFNNSCVIFTKDICRRKLRCVFKNVMI